MILDTKVGFVKSSGIVDTTEFTIAANAKMFSMLTDGLYSDKITSIVRELSSNAHDSHIEAGHDKKFYVTCPTLISPIFSIRDYGLGLSTEKIKEIYTVLGASDKTESNEFVGCLGIGSKSPFCYTNNFSVTSFHNGKKSIYSCYKNEDGIPCISLLSCEDSNEPSGMLIEISVPSKDLIEWNSAINKNYEFYSVLPNSNIELSLQNVKSEFKIGDIEVCTYETTSANNSRHIYILMGHNKYILDKVFADLEFYIPYGTNILIKVPIGAVSVDISRERLQFDKKTESQLTKIMNSIKVHMLRDLQSKIDACDSEYEAMLVDTNMSGIELKNLGKILKYKDKSRDNIVNRYTHIDSSYQCMMIDTNGKGKRKTYVYFYDCKKIIVDDNKTSIATISKFLNGQKALFFKPKENIDKCIKFLEDFGIPKKYIILTSTLNLKNKQFSSFVPMKLMILNGRELVETKNIPSKGDYYIERFGNKVNFTKTDYLVIKILNINVWCLTKSQIKKFTNLELLTKDKISILMKDFLSKNGIQYNYVTSSSKYRDILSFLSKDIKEFDKYLKDLHSIETEKNNTLDKLSNLGITLGVTKNLFIDCLPKKECNIDKILLDKYPLLSLIDIYSLNSLNSVGKLDLIKYFKEKNNGVSSN